MRNKKGMGDANWVISGVIGAVILVLVVVALYPTLNVALGNISSTGMPLASLFAQGGIIALVFAAAVFYGLYRLFWKKGQ